MQIRRLANPDRTRYRAIEVLEEASHTTHEIDEPEICPTEKVFQVNNEETMEGTINGGAEHSCSIVGENAPVIEDHGGNFLDSTEMLLEAKREI